MGNQAANLPYHKVKVFKGASLCTRGSFTCILSTSARSATRTLSLSSQEVPFRFAWRERERESIIKTRDETKKLLSLFIIIPSLLFITYVPPYVRLCLNVVQMIECLHLEASNGPKDKSAFRPIKKDGPVGRGMASAPTCSVVDSQLSAFPSRSRVSIFRWRTRQLTGKAEYLAELALLKIDLSHRRCHELLVLDPATPSLQALTAW